MQQNCLYMLPTRQSTDSMLLSQITCTWGITSIGLAADDLPCKLNQAVGDDILDVILVSLQITAQHEEAV